MKRTDARKPESGHAPQSSQPFFGAQAATAFFTSGQSVQRDPFFQHGVSASVPLQAKLTVGAVGDKYEQEADRVAATVVDQINRPAGPVGSDRSSVQRLRGEEEVQMRRSPDALQRVEQEEELQMKPIADTIQRMGPAEEDELQMKPDWLQRETDPEEEDELQMKAIAPQVTTQGGDVSSNLEASIQQARGGGQAIAENVRVPLEQAFGADFSGVRVHTDAKSDQLNQSIQAKAFTTGQDVFFRQGAYEPGSRGGQELIAHELTHVVQQKGTHIQRHEESQAKLHPVISKTLSSTIQCKRFEVGEFIDFTAPDPVNNTQAKDYKGFVIAIKTDSDQDNQVVYEVDARMDGTSKSLLVKNQQLLSEEKAPQITKDDEVNSLFDKGNDDLKKIIGLDIVFVTEENKAKLTRFGQVQPGDILVGEGIVIKDPGTDRQAFVKGVTRDLLTISKTKSGKALLFSLNAAATAQGKALGGKNVITTIQQTLGRSTTDPAVSQWEGKAGQVADATIGYEPGLSGIMPTSRQEQELNVLLNAPNTPDTVKQNMKQAFIDPLIHGWGRPKEKPSDVTLFHELVHAEDLMRGRLYKETGVRGQNDQKIEVAEMRAVGLEEYYDKDFITGKEKYPVMYSENTYRHERGLALREFYSYPNEGPLVPLTHFPSPKALHPVPPPVQVPERYKGISKMRHKLTPGDGAIQVRESEINAAMLQQQQRNNLIKQNEEITAQNKVLEDREKLLNATQATGLAARLEVLKKLGRTKNV